MSWLFGLLNRRLRPAEVKPSPAPAPAGGREWAALPPIQRTAGDLQLTAPALEFARGLPGSHGQDLVMQPLGHARSPEAPSGLVAGLASAVSVQTYASKESFVHRPVQRTPKLDREPGASRWRQPAPTRPDLSVAAQVGEERQASANPVVSAEASIEEKQAAPPMPTPLVPRVVPVIAPQSMRESLTASRLNEVPVAPPPALTTPNPRPLPVEMASEDGPDTQLAFPPSVAQRSSAEAAPPASTRLNLGQSRRLGLGPPLRSVPSVSQRMPSEAAPEPSALPAQLAAAEVGERGSRDAETPLAPAAADFLESSLVQHVEPAPATHGQCSLEATSTSERPGTRTEPDPGAPTQRSVEATPPAAHARPAGMVPVQRSVVARPSAEPPATLGLDRPPQPLAAGPPAEAGARPAMGPPILRVQRSRETGAPPETAQRVAPAAPADLSLPLAPPSFRGKPADGGEAVVQPAQRSAPEPASPLPSDTDPVSPEPAAPQPVALPASDLELPESGTPPAPTSASTSPFPPLPAQASSEAAPLFSRPSTAFSVSRIWVPAEGPTKGLPSRIDPPAPNPASASARPPLPGQAIQRFSSSEAGRSPSGPSTAFPVTGTGVPAAPLDTGAATGPPTAGSGSVLPLAAERGLATRAALSLATVAQRSTSSRKPEPAPAPVTLSSLAPAAIALGAPLSPWSQPLASRHPGALALAPSGSREPAGLFLQTIPEAASPLRRGIRAAASTVAIEDSFATGVQRDGSGPSIAAMGPASAEALPAQRAIEASAPAPPASAGARAEPAGTGQGLGGVPSEGELDDLAHRLYDRLRSQLRLELLIDRERAGLITDLQ